MFTPGLMVPGQNNLFQDEYFFKHVQYNMHTSNTVWLHSWGDFLSKWDVFLLRLSEKCLKHKNQQKWLYMLGFPESKINIIGDEINILLESELDCLNSALA